MKSQTFSDMPIDMNKLMTNGFLDCIIDGEKRKIKCDYRFMWLEDMNGNVICSPSDFTNNFTYERMEYL